MKQYQKPFSSFKINIPCMCLMLLYNALYHRLILYFSQQILTFIEDDNYVRNFVHIV